MYPNRTRQKQTRSSSPRNHRPSWTPPMRLGLEIIKNLNSQGYQAVLHGGTVLVELCRRTCSDYFPIYDLDIVVAGASLQDVEGVMRKRGYILNGEPREINEKTNCQFVCLGSLPIDITITPTIDQPSFVGWDCDAIYMGADTKALPESAVENFLQGKIAACPDIDTLIRENPHAVFRLARLMTMYGVMPEDRDLEVIRQHAREIVQTTPQYKIYSEMCKCLTRGNQLDYLWYLNDLGLLQHINPHFSNLFKNDGQMLLGFVSANFMDDSSYDYITMRNHSIALFLLPEAFRPGANITNIVEHFLYQHPINEEDIYSQQHKGMIATIAGLIDSYFMSYSDYLGGRAWRQRKVISPQSFLFESYYNPGSCHPHEIETGPQPIALQVR